MKENKSLEEDCSFITERLRVNSWQHCASTINDKDALFNKVISTLTPEVTKALPPGWQDISTIEKANDWVEARLQESALFSIQLTPDNSLVGFLILNGEASSKPDLIDVHLGYLLSKETWGKGLGSELIKGLVSWSESVGSISSIFGGVETDNIASIKVLEKNGFTPASSEQVIEGMVFLERKF
jgi:RimJ/RimL family protein N-acetyltransferase